jgi:4-hydroxy-2-oxoheptanedioate aldolase
MMHNVAKARLKRGEIVHGCFVRYPDATLAEVLCLQPWDFLLFDGEHGTIEPRDCEHLVRAAELRGVTPLVRVPANQPAIILRYLDTGAYGLHVPWVNSAAEAEAAVRAVKYQPRGQRGLAAVRAADFGQTMPLSDYVARANAETLVVLHVETVQAVAALSDMLAIDGVDVLFIGPTDLSHSLGYPGQPQHPEVQAVMQQIAAQVAQSDKALGILVQNADAAREWITRGARYIATGVEALLAPAMRNYLERVRGVPQGR